METQLLSPKRWQSPTPIFGPSLLWPNGCMHQDATWYGGRPRAGTPSNSKSSEPRPISVPSGILIHPTVWPLQTWAENGGCVPFWGSWVPIKHNMARAEAYFNASFILIHAAVWPQRTWAENWGGCAPLGRAGSLSTTRWPGPRPTSVPSFILVHPAVWPQRTWTESVPLLGELGPHLTQCGRDRGLRAC